MQSAIARSLEHLETNPSAQHSYVVKTHEKRLATIDLVQECNGWLLDRGHCLDEKAPPIIDEDSVAALMAPPPAGAFALSLGM